MQWQCPHPSSALLSVFDVAAVSKINTPILDLVCCHYFYTVDSVNDATAGN
jgi:hypothetical protein